MTQVGVVGAGRVGSVLTAKLRTAGYSVLGVSGSSDASRLRVATLIPDVPILEPASLAAEAELLILAVSDDALASVVSDLAPVAQSGTLVCHTSGRFGREVLAPFAARGARTFAFHPAMTFTGTAVDLERTFVVGATAEEADRDSVTELAHALGATVAFIDEADRVRYHAALTHGANHLTALVVEAMNILSSIGLEHPHEFLRPLLSAALNNTVEFGPAALTGPISRGDINTVASHLAALDEPERSTYRALALSTIQLALADQRISQEIADDMAEQIEAQVAE